MSPPIPYDTRMVLSIGYLGSRHRYWQSCPLGRGCQVFRQDGLGLVTDRDGQTAGVLGATVNWALEPVKVSGSIEMAPMARSVITTSLPAHLRPEWFPGWTSGVVTDPAAHPLTGTSILRMPTSYEIQSLINSGVLLPARNPANPDPAKSRFTWRYSTNQS